MKQLSDYSEGDIIVFKTRYNQKKYKGIIHYYRMEKGHIFISVRTKSFQFIQSEITEIL